MSILEYADDDLTFFLSSYRDCKLTENCLLHLRENFPYARVVVRSDGDDDPRYANLVDRFRIEFFSEDRLFPVENGAAVVARMFDIFLREPTRYLFKIDPDTIVHRRFRFLPSRSGLFGTLQGRAPCLAVQGGCMGFTADVAKTFSESGLLGSPDFKRPEQRRNESRYWTVLANRARRCGLTSFDWTLGWTATELQIPMFAFPEVHSTWKEPVDNRDLRFAITHPDCRRDQ